MLAPIHCCPSRRIKSWLTVTSAAALFVFLAGGCPVNEVPDGDPNDGTPSQNENNNTNDNGSDDDPGQDQPNINDNDNDNGDPGNGNTNDNGGDDPVEDQTPRIDAFDDLTGLLTIVGDMIELAGENLDIDAATVGGEPADIISAGDTSAQIQIPANIPAGDNVLRVEKTVDGQTLSDEVTINVRKLALFIGSNADVVVVVDTLDQSVVDRIANFEFSTLPTMLPNPPYTLAFANHGALALLPLGDGQIGWIDLTSVSGANVRTGKLALHNTNNNATTMTTIGIAVSPDNRVAVVADETREELYTVTIDEQVPPFNAPVTWAETFPMPLNTGPRAPAFLSDTFLVVPGLTSDNLTLLQLAGTTLSSLGTANTGDAPAQATFVASHDSLLAATRDDNTVASFTTASVAVDAPDSAVTVNQVIAFATDKAGNRAFAISLSSDQVTRIGITDAALSNEGAAADTLTSNQARSIAIEPVEGELLYVGLNTGDFVDIFDVADDGTLTRRNAHPLAGDADLERCMGIGIQQ